MLQHVGVILINELCCIICNLLYFIVCICWSTYWCSKLHCMSGIQFFMHIFMTGVGNELIEPYHKQHALSDLITCLKNNTDCTPWTQLTVLPFIVLLVSECRLGYRGTCLFPPNLCFQINPYCFAVLALSYLVTLCVILKILSCF